MHNSKKIPIAGLNEFLTCKLCKGYFIDATTIIECLHTFCRSCIVQYLGKNKYCPVCDVQVHKNKPLLNIRPDKIIQDIVYKLVPRLFQNEMCKRREFYSVHPEARPSNLEQCGEASYQHILSADETIFITLNYSDSSEPPRYLKCPAGLSVIHLQKLLRHKYGLTNNYQVDIFYNQDCLSPHITMMDIAYIYLWRRKRPLELTYTISENSTASRNTLPSLPHQPESETTSATNNNNESNSSWKEVQLQISENGEMCFTNIDSTVVLNEVAKSKNAGETELIPSDIPIMHVNSDTITLDVVNKPSVQNEDISCENSSISESPKVAEATTSLISTNDCDSKPQLIEITTNENDKKCSVNIVTAAKETELLFNGKHKLPRSNEDEPSVKQSKPTILNYGLKQLSNNHPLKRNNQLRKSVEAISPETILLPLVPVTSSSPSTSSNFVSMSNCSSKQPKPTIIKESNNIPSNCNASTIVPQRLLNKIPSTKLPCYSPKATHNPVINVPKVQTPSSIIKSKVPINTMVNHKMTTKSKPSNSIGYKTLREPPKTWNPQLPRASLLLKGAEQKELDNKNAKPAKFFKMRNNMPRYLGNPSSGVKPLYQVHNSQSPEKDKGKEVKKTEIKRHSIVKIDSKTLKPISEKASDSNSLSNHCELKINTSSVSIFNPLKSSPKHDRRSPKSPQSPKTSPTPKREKLNLNYIPPNPFIPNLASPTVSPNQFLFPPGFPTYDHRLVAAYHNLLFGQRLPLATPLRLPTLNYDLSKWKVYDAPSCTSPAAPTSPLPLNTKEVSKKSETVAKVAEGKIQMGSTELHAVQKKKPSKEAGKSLENTVEKLTQNKVKELKKAEMCSEQNGIATKADVLDSKPNNHIDDGKSKDDNLLLSNNSTESIEKSESRTELEIQNGDKSVSNNNTIESVSLEEVNKV